VQTGGKGQGEGGGRDLADGGVDSRRPWASVIGRRLAPDAVSRLLHSRATNGGPLAAGQAAAEEVWNVVSVTTPRAGLGTRRSRRWKRLPGPRMDLTCGGGRDKRGYPVQWRRWRAVAPRRLGPGGLHDEGGPFRGAVGIRP